MKKGFTLIELLAVIVILAIIAVIAVPIVINIIEDTKINSIKTSASMYLKSAELYISNAELNKVKIESGTYGITEEGDICTGIIEENECNGEIINIEIKGSKPNSGQIIINEKGNVKIEYLEIDGYTYYKDDDEYIVEKVTKETKESDNGVITLDSSKIPYLTNYKIYGNSIQETETIQSAGNLVTDSTHEHYGEYEIPIKVTGKNFAKNDSIENPDSNYSNSGGGTKVIQYSEVEEGYYTTNHRNRDFGKLKPGIYTLSLIAKLRSDGGNGNAILTTDNAGYGYQALTKSKLTNEYQLFTYTFEVLKERNFKITIYNTLYFKNIQLERNDVPTTYEPYKEEIYSIYLEEPLRCVGKVCDYIDFESGKVVRYIEEIDNTGTKTIEESFVVLNKPRIENIELPKIKIYEGVSNIFIETDIKPSDVTVEYYK